MFKSRFRGPIAGVDCCQRRRVSCLSHAAVPRPVPLRSPPSCLLQSSTYQADGRPFYIQYGSGPVSGYVGKDVVNIGGVTATGVDFAEITDASGLGLAYS